MNQEHPELPTIPISTASELSRLLNIPDVYSLNGLQNIPNTRSVEDATSMLPNLLPTTDMQQQLAILQLQLQMGILPPLMPLQQFSSMQLLAPGNMGLDPLSISLLQGALQFQPPTTLPQMMSFNGYQQPQQPSQPSVSSLPTHLHNHSRLNPAPSNELPVQSTSSGAMSSPPSPIDVTTTSATGSESPELRRKRSRASAEPQVSVLRQLCEEDDVEVIKLQKFDDEDTRIRAHSLSYIQRPYIMQPSRKHSEVPIPTRPLRRLYRDSDLPNTVGPDSPFRHHPKYQAQRKKDPENELLQEFEAITTMVMVNGFMPKPLRERLIQDNERSKSATPPKRAKETSTPRAEQAQPGSSPRTDCPMQEFMENVISRELVTCE